MLSEKLRSAVASHMDFPKAGILFRDITPVLSDPKLVEDLIDGMANFHESTLSEAIVAIDARGFIFGSMLAQKLKKPLILARKKNKLPGDLIQNDYQLEYGRDSLAIKKESILKINNFIIVDDLLATGGTAKCISDLLESNNKKVLALLVVIELESLLGRNKFKFPVHSLLQYK